MSYFEKKVGRFIVNKRNNPSTSRLNKLDIRGSNIGSIRGIIESSRCTITGMRKNSDNRAEIEARISSWTGSRGLTGQEEWVLGGLNWFSFGERDKEGNPDIVEHGVVWICGNGCGW